MAPHCDRRDRGDCQEQWESSGLKSSRPWSTHKSITEWPRERGPIPVFLVQLKKPSHQEDHMTCLRSVAGKSQGRVASWKERTLESLPVIRAHSHASDVGITQLRLGWTARADFREPASSLMRWCLGPKFPGSQGSWSSRLTTCLLQAIAPAPGEPTDQKCRLVSHLSRGMVWFLASVFNHHLVSTYPVLP